MNRKRTANKKEGFTSGGSLETPLPTPSLPTAINTDVLIHPALPRWKRAHDSKSRKMVARILVLKLAGRKTSEIAKKLDTSADTIRHYLWLAGKNGWLTEDKMSLVDPSEQLAFGAAQKVVRNINRSLDGQFMMPQQFEMTIETAKGIGLFKNHTAAKIEGTMQVPSLEVNITMPAGAANYEAPSQGSLGGTPAYIEGESYEPKLIEGKE